MGDSGRWKRQGHGPPLEGQGGAQPCNTRCQPRETRARLLTPGLWGNKSACVLKLRQKKHTTLYWFQGCSARIQYLYILRNDHHSRSNICHQMELQSFLLVMRTFKVYSLSNFQMCNTTLFTIAWLSFSSLKQDEYDTDLSPTTLSLSSSNHMPSPQGIAPPARTPKKRP